MGYWEQDEEGHSFALGSGMIWGDTPADRFSEMETGPATGWGAIPDDSYECPLCTARLKYHMSLIAGFDFFTLQPGQTILVPDVPPTPGAPR